MSFRLILLSLVFSLVSALVPAQDKKMPTRYELSGCLATPRYDETIQYCRQLDKESKLISYTTFGVSPQGRELPLLIADKKGRTDLKKIKDSGNALLMIQACIHSGESEGKDAGLMLFRDLALGYLPKSLLDSVSIAFIPIFNVDGHERFSPYSRINQNGPVEMGWRTTAQNLNLNRDYLKADAPEMQAWLRLFNSAKPDFFIDCHTTDGADYQYVMTYDLNGQGGMDNELAHFIQNSIEPYYISGMEKAGMPVFPYVEFRNWHDPRSGLSSGVAPPMLSQGYCAVQNVPGLLLETHMLKAYKPRVEATYQSLLLMLQYTGSHCSELKHKISNADNNCRNGNILKEPLVLSFKTLWTDSTMVDFKGFEYTVKTSDLTGGEWFRYDNTKPVTWKLPLFGSVPDAQIQLPAAYVIPQEWSFVADRLRLHGIEYKTLEQNVETEAVVSRFTDANWQDNSYEGHHRLNYNINESVETVPLRKGDILVLLNQPAARVAVHLLEPLSPNSLVRWGFFDAIFERKEYFESYVMEPMAREMIKKDPALLDRFNQWKDTFGSTPPDPYMQLWWFYQQTPYSDQKQNVYPVVKLKNVDQVE